MKRLSYYELIKLIERISLSHPYVNSFYQDIDINSESNIRFASIVLVDGTHSDSGNLTTYNFEIIYADRLTTDRDNSLEIKSAGMDAVKEIINTLKGNYMVSLSTDNSINVFKQRFVDECAGIVMSFSITMPSNAGNCQTPFKDCCNV